MNFELSDRLHPQLLRLLERRAARGRVEIAWLAAADARKAKQDEDQGAPCLSGTDPNVEIRDINHGRLTLRKYSPPESSLADVVVYMHGGGWVLGDLDGSDPVCSLLAQRCNRDVVSVGYRLAPENPFPAALDDCYEALIWANQEYSGHLVVVGESAGGNLATATLIRAVKRGGPRVALQVLVYPVVDYQLDDESFMQYGAVPYLLTGADLAWFWRQYVADVDKRSDPEVSPVKACLTGVAPTLMVLARVDPLYDQGMRYADALEAAGIPVRICVYEDMVHGFFPLVGDLEVARQAVRTIASAIDTHCGKEEAA